MIDNNNLKTKKEHVTRFKQLLQRTPISKKQLRRQTDGNEDKTREKMK
jgi:hypothetical protein